MYIYHNSSFIGQLRSFYYRTLCLKCLNSVKLRQCTRSDRLNVDFGSLYFSCGGFTKTRAKMVLLGPSNHLIFAASRRVSYIRCIACVVTGVRRRWGWHMWFPYAYCLRQARRASLSTRAPVQSLTTANQRRTKSQMFSSSTVCTVCYLAHDGKFSYSSAVILHTPLIQPTSAVNSTQCIQRHGKTRINYAIF